MDHLITVRAAASGWSVASSSTDNEMLFLSAEKAEAAARALAKALAEASEGAAVQVWSRDGRLAGQVRRPPDPLRAGAI